MKKEKGEDKKEKQNKGGTIQINQPMVSQEKMRRDLLDKWLIELEMTREKTDKKEQEMKDFVELYKWIYVQL